MKPIKPPFFLCKAVLVVLNGDPQIVLTASKDRRICCSFPDFTNVDIDTGAVQISPSELKMTMPTKGSAKQENQVFEGNIWQYRPLQRFSNAALGDLYQVKALDCPFLGKEKHPSMERDPSMIDKVAPENNGILIYMFLKL